MFSRYPHPEEWIFNCVISAISVVLRETTITTSDSIWTGLPVKSETVRVVLFSTCTTEITMIIRFKKTIFRVQIH